MKLTCYPLILLLFLLSACRDNSADKTEPSEEPFTIQWPVESIRMDLLEAVFTESDKIKEGLSSTVIQDRLIDLIDATPEGSSIYAFYDFEFVVNALERADSRNVELYIMFDMSRHNENLVNANKSTVEEVKNLGDNVEVIFVDNDTGAIAINYNKFVLFSEVVTEEGNKENIVFQTSHNFTEYDTHRIQDAVILDHQGLYQVYLDYWEDMKTKASEGMQNFEYREFNDPKSGITAYFYLKRKRMIFLITELYYAKSSS